MVVLLTVCEIGPTTKLSYTVYVTLISKRVTTVLTQDGLYEQSDEELPPSESLSWADGCLLVYAITDRRSFNYVRRARQGLGELPAVLVGNKADMVHLRQVSTEEGNVPWTMS